MDPVGVLIAFYSRNGNTARLAEAVAEGARSEGATVTLRRIDEFVPDAVIAGVPGWAENRARLRESYPAPTPADAEAADAIVFGTPTRFGNASAELKSYIDSLGALWAKGALSGKVGSAFVSTSSVHGGNETTILTLYVPMAHFGMIIVPPGFDLQESFQSGSPYGATSVSANADRPPTDGDLAVARHQGAKVARVAKALKAAQL